MNNAASGQWGLPADKFRPAKTFLDPVHKDIEVLALEAEVIDTFAFQRLRGVKQLGTADLVYHGAKHDRYGHSIGTMFAADLMVRRINSRVELTGYGRCIEPNARFLIRLAALLHDIGHAPYGHQLEDDFPILLKHDRPERYAELLGPNSEIGRILGDDLSGLLIATLSAKDDSDIARLPFPFVSDIVGNTVCADLLDYTRRDIYYTGLDKQSGWRMLKYLYIPTDGPRQNRVVLDAWKDDHLRWDIISDVLDLLDVRFSLSERVLFHHSKMATGAMLARAVHESNLDANAIVDCRDDQLLAKVAASESPIAKRIIDDFLHRRMYKSVWTSHLNISSEERGALIERFAIAHQSEGEDPRRLAFLRKVDFENTLSDRLGVDRGAILISCPTEKMLFKRADVWCNINGRILKLGEISTDPPKGAISEMKARHEALWRFHVFMRPDLVDDHAAALADALGLLLPGGVQYNGIAKWPASGGQAIVQRFVSTGSTEWDPPVLAREHPTLVAAAKSLDAEGSFDELLASALHRLRAGEGTTSVGQEPSWREKYEWFVHGRLDWTIGDERAVAALKHRFGVADDVDEQQINLLLHLEAVLDGLPENDILVGTTTRIVDRIETDAAGVYSVAASLDGVVVSHREAGTEPSVDEKTLTAEQTFRTLFAE